MGNLHSKITQLKVVGNFLKVAKFPAFLTTDVFRSAVRIVVHIVCAFIFYVTSFFYVYSFFLRSFILFMYILVKFTQTNQRQYHSLSFLLLNSVFYQLLSSIFTSTKFVPYSV